MTRTGLSANDVRLAPAFAFLLNGILLLVFLYSQFLKRMLRTYTTYLILQGESAWEQDRRQFRKSFKVRAEWHEWAQATIFLVLGAGASAFPIVIASIVNVEIPVFWFGVLTASTAAYLLLVLGFGFWNWDDREPEVEEQWKQILSNKVDVTQSANGTRGRIRRRETTANRPRAEQVAETLDR